jgi:hypothetical protein
MRAQTSFGMVLLAGTSSLKHADELSLRVIGRALDGGLEGFLLDGR